MYEHVLRAGHAHAGGLDAAAIVVVLEEPDADRLFQRTDPLVGGSRHGHAEEADRRDVEEDAGMLARMPRRGLLHLPHVRILDLDARLVPDVVGHRPEEADAGVAPEMVHRSEEHTSELQSLMSLSYAVFCLKQNKRNPSTH